MSMDSSPSTSLDADKEFLVRMAPSALLARLARMVETVEMAVMEKMGRRANQGLKV